MRIWLQNWFLPIFWQNSFYPLRCCRIRICASRFITFLDQILCLTKHPVTQCPQCGHLLGCATVFWIAVLNSITMLYSEKSSRDCRSYFSWWSWEETHQKRMADQNCCAGSRAVQAQADLAGAYNTCWMSLPYLRRQNWELSPWTALDCVQLRIVVKQSSGRSSSHQAVIRQSSGSFQIDINLYALSFLAQPTYLWDWVISVLLMHFFLGWA